MSSPVSEEKYPGPLRKWGRQNYPSLGPVPVIVDDIDHDTQAQAMSGINKVTWHRQRAARSGLGANGKFRIGNPSSVPVRRLRQVALTTTVVAPVSATMF